MQTPANQVTFGELLPFIIAIIILIALIAFCIFMAIKTGKARNARKRKNAMYRQTYQTGIFQPVQESLILASGLPIASGTSCSVKLNENGMSIESSGTVFNISIDKITDISIKTDREIQTAQHYVSSAGGAIAGALMFGIPGALVGGRAKKKKTTTVTYSHFMIVTYKKDDTVAYVAFALPGSVAPAVHFINNFNLLTANKENAVIDL